MAAALGCAADHGFFGYQDHYPVDLPDGDGQVLGGVEGSYRSKLTVFVRPDGTIELISLDYFNESRLNTIALVADVEASLREAFPNHRIEVIQSTVRKLPP